VLDGKIQSSEKDEFIYHETLVHPAMITHHYPESVFIAGGGEGATLREVLRHPSVKRVVMVDIDKEVIDICRRFLPSFHQGAFDDSRLELHMVDVKGYLDKCQEKFDVIILDLPEPIEEGPASMLHTMEFYQLVADKLGPESILSLQAGSSSWGSHECFTAIINTLKSVFSLVYPYATHIPSYASVWGFAVASQTLHLLPLAGIDSKISSRMEGGLKFYDGLTHRGLFTLPKTLRESIDREERVITEQEPLFIYKP
ncbi:MAG: spermidine synthase, partial [Dehalococcoidia bacterium]